MGKKTAIAEIRQEFAQPLQEIDQQQVTAHMNKRPASSHGMYAGFHSQREQHEG
jgi:hypothetical protein